VKKEVSFYDALAEAAARSKMPDTYSIHRQSQRLCYQVALLSGVAVQRTSSDVRSASYYDESMSEMETSKAATMVEAVRTLEVTLRSSPSLPANQLRLLRREVALIVHPDLCTGSDKRIADDLMKIVNALVSAALGKVP